MNIRAAALLVAFAAALVAPSGAQALTVGVQDGVLRVTGSPGEVERLSIESAANKRVRFNQIFDDDVTEGATCRFDQELVCNAESAIVVNLGDRNDELSMRPGLPAPVRYSGGPGRDVVRWSHIDGISVAADNDGRPDDGPLGLDDIEADVETVVGGFADDVLGSGSRGASMNGSEGDDVVRGGSGPDRITAAYIATDGTEADFLFTEGSDTISCGGGHDFVLHDSSDVVANDCEAFGRPNGKHYLFRGTSRNDFLGAPSGWEPARMYAGAGNDVVQGGDYGFKQTRVELGSGNDRYRAGTPSKVFGQSGRDSIDVRNRRTVDEVYCGSGRDSVRADRGDKISSTCEIVRRLPVR
jgi:hypothetical protein